MVSPILKYSKPETVSPKFEVDCMEIDVKNCIGKRILYHTGYNETVVREAVVLEISSNKNWVKLEDVISDGTKNISWEMISEITVADILKDSMRLKKYDLLWKEDYTIGKLFVNGNKLTFELDLAVIKCLDC